MQIFKIEGGVLYQWDTGRQIECLSVPGYTVDEVNFVNPVGDASFVVEPITKDGKKFVPIPNILLQSSENLKVYAVMHTDEGERTIRECGFSVIPRQKPSDYVYTETEIYSIKTALNRALLEAKESGTFDGKDGATPVRGVDYWTPEDERDIRTYIDTKISPLLEEINGVEETLRMLNEGGLE